MQHCKGHFPQPVPVSALAGVARVPTGCSRVAVVGRGDGGVVVAQARKRGALEAAGGGGVVVAEARLRVAAVAAGGGGVVVADAGSGEAVGPAGGGGVVVAAVGTSDAAVPERPRLVVIAPCRRGCAIGALGYRHRARAARLAARISLLHP